LVFISGKDSLSAKTKSATLESFCYWWTAYFFWLSFTIGSATGIFLRISWSFICTFGSYGDLIIILGLRKSGLETEVLKTCC